MSILATPAAAKAPQEMGPTATANVEISVSVARRYGLAVVETGPDVGVTGRGQYCMASNGNEMHLPVMLISVSESRTYPDVRPAQQAVQLAPCASSRGPLDSARPFGGATREVIVRPE